MAQETNNNDIVEKALFFPSQENETILSEELMKAKKTLDIAIFTFTNKVLAKTIYKLVTEYNVKVRIISDDVQASTPYSLVGVLQSASDKQVEVRIDNNKVSLMHNKYVIIDGKTVITGSFNWTQQAVKFNNENVVICRGINISKQFKANFNMLWEQFSDNKFKIESAIREKGKDFKKSAEQFDKVKLMKLRTKKSLYSQLKEKAQKEVTKKIKKTKKSNKSKSSPKNSAVQNKKPKKSSQKKSKKNDNSNEEDGDYNPEDEESKEESFEEEDEEENNDEDEIPEEKVKRKSRKRSQKKDNKIEEEKNTENPENQQKKSSVKNSVFGALKKMTVIGSLFGLGYLNKVNNEQM